jgi:hypothetical protein
MRRSVSSSSDPAALGVRRLLLTVLYQIASRFHQSLLIAVVNHEKSDIRSRIKVPHFGSREMT